MNGKYEIRIMTPEEAENIAVKWAAKEGWNPGLYDSRCFYETDPNGFLIGVLDGKPAASISAVKYDSGFGFIGFYIVAPEFRGLGYGIKIWNAAVEYLRDVNIGLDGVVAQQGNYAKSGFRLAYSNIRHKGITAASSVTYPDIVSIYDVPFEMISSYDRCVFPAARNVFLKNWFLLPESKSAACIRDNELTGFATIRKCSEGYKIGPLFADTYVIAEKLFATLCNFTAPGSKVFLDTPETNPHALMLAQKFNMEKVFETARMYTKEFPAIDIQKIYGVTTFELG